MKSELEKLIALQKTDTNIRRLKKSIDSSELRRANLEQEFEQHAFSIREIQAKRDSLHAERAELEARVAFGFPPDTAVREDARPGAQRGPV